MSKFLCLGVELGKVVAMATHNPARAIGKPELGTLKNDGCGDCTVLEVRDGKFDYTDCIGEQIIGKQKLVSAGVVIGGKWWHPA
jgi:dihydroorotase